MAFAVGVFFLVHVRSLKLGQTGAVIVFSKPPADVGSLLGGKGWLRENWNCVRLCESA
jgi:hypothetical protein